MSDPVDTTGPLPEDLLRLRRRVEELEALAALRKEELDRLRSSAALEKHEAVKQLTEGICHEILNPLSIILMLVYKAGDDAEDHSSALERLKIIEENAHRIKDIIKGLVLFSRQRMPDRQPVDLNEELRSFFALKETELAGRKITVELKLEEALPPISLDAEQLKQVVSHLVSNAGDAMPEGGRLVLSTGVVCENGLSFAKLRLEDTGCGISPEAEGNLFEPFFSTKPEGQGKGLGLAVCRGIVEAHGGSIRAESGESRGTAFTIKLPL